MMNIYNIKTNEKIVSDYKSPANAYASANLSFKFSINGKDNEIMAIMGAY